MRRLRREEGVVMVMVATLMVMLFAMAGLAVDLGALYSERRELRTAADAAALGIAETCGRGTGPCSQSAAETTAAQYAGWNSADGASRAQVSLTKEPDGTGWVRVVTSAFDQEAGVAGVRVPFMSVLGIERIDVTAAATAIFGYPGSEYTLPLAIAAGEWPGRFGLGAADDVTDFGWLRGSGCPTTLTAWTWRNGSTDNEPQCTAQYLRDHVYGRNILVALFFNEDPVGNRYQVAGFGYFHVIGYKLNPLDDSHTWPTGFTCEDGGPVCLRGYFDTRTVSSGDPGGADFGVVLVKLTE